MDTVTQLAQEYNINTAKPHFPINTMRLFYLLLTQAETRGNKEALDRVNQIIPKISAVLDARDVALTNKTDQATPIDQFNHCQPPLNELLKQVDSTELRQTINVLFIDVYPLQEVLLTSIDSFLKQDKLSLDNLYSALRIRSMDSILYAGVLAEIIQEYTSVEGSRQLEINPLYWQISITLQLNDLADAIVYAKQDLASKSATIVELIRRVITPENNVIQTVQTAVSHLQSLSQSGPLKSNQSVVDEFNQKLAQVIG